MRLTWSHPNAVFATVAGGAMLDVVANSRSPEQFGPALAHAAFIGSAGEGRISAASRADYAAAAVAVLTGDGHAGKTYELAGDHAFSMAVLAAQVTRQLGRPITYQDLPSEHYQGALVGAGVPEMSASMSFWMPATMNTSTQAPSRKRGKSGSRSAVDGLAADIVADDSARGTRVVAGSERW
jgi:hypothetical protein